MNMEKTLIITSTFSGGACDASMVLGLLEQSQSSFKGLGYKTGLCFTVNGSEEPTEEVVEIFFPSFPGEKQMLVNKERQGRGPCFIGGVKNALEMIGPSVQDATIITADLCGKAPHDPRLFPPFLKMLEGHPNKVVVGSTRYDSKSIDDYEMRAMAFYQYCKFGADGEPFNIQSPALVVGPAVLFQKALQLYDIYIENYPKYTDEPWPGPGVPGLLLCMLYFAGAKLHGVTLPVFGEWRPSRTWEQLFPHMKATILHAEIADQMKKDGLFDQ